MTEVVHFFAHFRTLGGVEAVLGQHYIHDSAWDMRSQFAIYNEWPAEPVDRVHFLGINSNTTLRAVRTKLQFLRDSSAAIVAVYHGAATMHAFICENDNAARRIVFLHGKGNPLEMEQKLRRTLVDGVICVNEETQSIAQGCLPYLPADRFVVVPVPITSCAGLAHHAPLAGRPIVIGYCGRLLKEHKRIDRLPQLCAHLDSLGADYRLEILGDGAEGPWLERQFTHQRHVRFLGRRNGDDYRRTVSAWDFIVFVSDTEGQPVSLLEAMSGGVIPVFPRINSAGDAYANEVDERLIYPPDATEVAAQIITRIGREPDDEVERLRARCLQAVSPNLDGTYFKQIARLAQLVLSSDRFSSKDFPRRPAWVNCLPLGIVTRAGHARRRLQEALARQG
jgi:glycosyltransferase involved in cell wall biosynthesis